MTKKDCIKETTEKKEPSFGWYGAGWACFKGDNVPSAEFLPPWDDDSAVFRWLDGFVAAHAEYPDDEALAGIMEGDFTRGESFDNALFRILKFPIYDQLDSSGTLKRYQEYLDEEQVEFFRRRSPNSGFQGKGGKDE